jgi:hypothetical protein
VRYVLLVDGNMPEHATDAAGGSASDMSHDIALMQAHLDSMQEQVGYLKSVVQTRDEELRRKDHIIAALTERIPELEPASNGSSEPREASQTASEEASGTPQPPSWWKRFFGLE